MAQAPTIEAIAVTVAQAAKMLGTNQGQIRKGLYSRELKAARLGKAYYIKVADLMRWFDSKVRNL